MTELTELLERVRGATGADGELDRDIHADLYGWKKVWNDELEFFQLWKDGRWIALGSIPHYTASVDDILALIERELPGWQHAYEKRTTGKCLAWVDNADDEPATPAIASTPALALCAAFLAAKISIETVP